MAKYDIQFGLNQSLEDLKAGKPMSGKDGFLTPEIALDELYNKWGKQYPVVIKSWRQKWDNLSVYFKYPED